LGVDHKKLTVRFGGRDMRLTDVHGEVVREIVALRAAPLGGTDTDPARLPGSESEPTKATYSATLGTRLR
jgi:hypothetical protein